MRLFRLLARGLRALLWLVLTVVGTVLNTVYKTVTRAALHLSMLAMSLHFLLNAGFGRDLVMGVLTEALPGFFDCEQMQWGPLPWRVTLLGADIRDPRGTPVIQVERATVTVDVAAMAGWGLKKLVFPERGFELRFTETVATGANVLVADDGAGFLGIERAFDTPAPGTPPSRHPARIDLGGCVLLDSQIRVDVPGVYVIGRGLNVWGGRVLVAGGRVRVSGPQLISRSGEVRVDGATLDGSALSIPWADLHANDVRWDAGDLRIAHARLIGSKAALQVSGWMSIRGVGTRWGATVSADFPPDDPLLRYFAGSSVAGGIRLRGRVDGPGRTLVADADLESDDLAVGGVLLGPLRWHLALAPEVVRAGLARSQLTVSPLSLDLLGGVVHVDSLRLWPWAPEAAEIALRLDDVRLEDLWTLGLVPSDVPVPALLEETVAGHVALFARHLPDATWAASADASLELRWAGRSGIPLGPVIRVAGDLDVSVTPAAGLTLESRGLVVDSGDDDVRVSGQYDVTGDRLDARLDATVHLGPFAERLGAPGLAGVVHLTGAEVTGPALSPTLSGRVAMGRGRIDPVAVEQVSARVTLAGGRLDTRDLVVRTDWGTVRTQASLQLYSTRLTALDPGLPLELRRLRVEGFDLERLKTGAVAGTAALTSARLRARLAAPGLGLAGTVSIRVPGLEAFGEVFESVRTDLTIDARRLAFGGIDVRSRSGATLTGSATWLRQGNRLRWDVVATGIDLARVRAIQRARIPIRGRLAEVRVQGTGTPQDPRLTGEVVFEDLAYDGLVLGGARVAFGRAAGGSRVTLTSRRFFPALTLTAGHIDLGSHLVPRSMELVADIEELDIWKLAPRWAAAARRFLPRLRVHHGTVGLVVPFAGPAPVRLTVELPSGGVEAGVAALGRTPVTNDGPARASLTGDKVSIESLIARWDSHRLGACGTLQGQRADLDLIGYVDLGALNLFRDQLASLSGTLRTHRPGQTAAVGLAGSCHRVLLGTDAHRRLGEPSAVLSVRGTLGGPRIHGYLMADDVRVLPRGLDRELAFKTGVLSFAWADGQQRLAVDPATPLAGALDEASFQVTGETTLLGWWPEKGSFELRTVDGTSFYFAHPKEYRVSFVPALTLSFAHLASGGPQQTLRLAGDVKVTDAVWFLSFDQFARALGNVRGRTVDVSSRPLVEMYPLLARMALDVRIHSEDFRLDTQFGLGSARLESRFRLRLANTLARPQAYGNVEITDGTLAYTAVVKHEFEVTRGQIEFDGDPEHPVMDVEAETTIDYSRPRVGASDTAEIDTEEVTIIAKLTGRLPKYQLAFDSKPTFGSQDIFWLLATGKTKADFEERGLSDAATLNIISSRIADAVSELFKAPFRGSIAPSPDGGQLWDFITTLGSQIRLGITGRQRGSETSFDAVFRVMINDRLSLEGKLRRGDDTQSSEQRYDAKLKYSIPLD